MKLFEEYWSCISFLFQDSDTVLLPREMSIDNEMYYAESYEDLLATAIINKVSNFNPPKL